MGGARSKRNVEANPEHGGFYKETVRNKAERQKMLAEPCTECKNVRSSTSPASELADTMPLAVL